MDLNALKIFIRVGETQSFTKAAQLSGLTQSGVSRAIARLELDLHVTLLNRNTHSVSLTADGLFLFESSKSLIHEMDEVGQLLSGRTVFPGGQFRITTPSAYGRLAIIPMFKQILDNSPALTIDAVMTDRLTDLVEEGFDAAIRIGNIQDSRLIARPLRQLRFVTVASPEYLDRHGIPQTPAELAQHNCLVVKAQKTGRATRWLYETDSGQQSFEVTGNLMVDTADVLLEAALSGIGMVQILDFAVDKYLENGRLIGLLPGTPGVQVPLSLIYAKSRHRSPKINTLLTAFGLNL